MRLFRRQKPPEPVPEKDAGIVASGPLFHYPTGMAACEAFMVIWTRSDGATQPVFFPAMVTREWKEAAGWAE